MAQTVEHEPVGGQPGADQGGAPPLAVEVVPSQGAPRPPRNSDPER